MAVAFVQAPSVNLSSLSGGDTTMDSLNFSSLPTIGNTVVGIAVGSSTDASDLQISDGYGNTYTNQVVSFGIATRTYYAVIGYTVVSSLPGSGFHITAAFDGTSSGYIGVYVAEFSGVGSSDGTLLSSNSSGSTNPAPSNLTVPSGNLSVVVFESNDSSFNETITTPSGWTLIDKIPGVPKIISACAYKINASSPSNPTWTIGTSCTWVALQRAFNPASAASGIDSLLMFHL